MDADRRDETRNTMATAVLTLAVGLALISFAEAPGPFNNMLQIVWVACIWIAAGSWAWLGRRKLLSKEGRIQVLWLLIPCFGTGTRPNLSGDLETVLVVVAVVLGVATLLLAFAEGLRASLGALARAVGLILLCLGILWVMIVLVSFASDAREGVYTLGLKIGSLLIGWEVPSEGLNHLYAILFGVLLALAGFGLCRVSGKLRAKE